MTTPSPPHPGSPTSSTTATGNAINTTSTTTTTRTSSTGSCPVAILIGPPGSGKSTVGRLLADLLNAGFLDSDDEVASVARKEVGDVFIEDGEAAFRALERPVVERALRYPGVVALGSGAVADEQTRRLLAGRHVVYLETGFAEVARRTGLNKPRVPVPGNPRGMLRAMLAKRHPLYESVARVTIQTDDLSPEEIARQVAQVAR